MARLDESAARRGDWSPGVAIRMADGQEWHFRRPKVKFKVQVGPDGKPLARRFSADAGRYYLDIMEEIARSPDDEAAFGTIVALTLASLRLNYDVPDEAVGDLYEYDKDDPDSRAMWEALYLLAVGQSPDPPSPVG